LPASDAARCRDGSARRDRRRSHRAWLWARGARGSRGRPRAVSRRLHRSVEAARHLANCLETLPNGTAAVGVDLVMLLAPSATFSRRLAESRLDEPFLLEARERRVHRAEGGLPAGARRDLSL